MTPPRSRRSTALLVLLLAACAVTPARSSSSPAAVPVALPITEGWTFARGDDPAWAIEPPADSSPIRVGVPWEDAGHAGYDGFGWYFVEFDHPDAFRTEEVAFHLGRIDDADEVFMNGVRIGATGRMPPAAASAWRADRTYVPPAAMVPGRIRLAVRVWDGGGGGGLYEGVPEILTKAEYDRRMRERYAPHRSFHDVPFANGLVSSKLNLEANAVDSFREHIYSQRDARTPTRDLLEALAFVGPDPGPRPTVRDAAYETGTGIVRWRVEAGGREAECFAFAPMAEEARRMYLLVRRGRGAGATARFEARLRIKEGIALQALSDRGAPALRREGAEAILEGIDPEAEWIGLAVTFTGVGETPSAAPPSLRPEDLLARERAWWIAWHRAGRAPAFKTEDERALFLQSTAVLKMAQCRESGRSRGQILASLPPGHWNICWIRDASYAVGGLVAAGHFEEARLALGFFLNAECGNYVRFEAGGVDHGVGVPYRISVCRYFGDGTEESDGGADPNIELDGFGLFLWALDLYVEASGDTALVERHRRDVFDLTADAIVHNVEADLDVIRRESGPWERHLIENGYNGARRFSYTSAACHRGLAAAARLAERIGDAALAARYRREADRLRAGFRRAFLTPPSAGLQAAYVRGLHEETDPARCQDAGAVEAVNFDLVGGDEARATLAAFDRFLKKPNTPGYMRNDDGGDYDLQEWVVIDLRIASAFFRLGEAARAETLIDWVTAQSTRNHRIIAELYSDESADYAGAVPMCGFGPGAYVLALFDRPVNRN